MANIDQIISVNISRETKGVSQVGFGTPMILGTTGFGASSDVIRTYTDMTGVVADFVSTTPEWAAANSIFSQQQTPQQIKIGFRPSVSGTPVSIATALSAISHVDDNWYCLLLTSRVDQDILDSAAYIEGQEKIFMACSNDAAILTSATSDLASQLKTLTYSRTTLLYSGNPSTYPEAGWAGLVLPYDPGSETWKFKTIQGSAADNLTATQSGFVKSKNANTYETYAGVSITGEGTMADAEFIDIIRFADWLKSRMQERIFGQLVNSVKIPYTDLGASLIESSIRAQLLAGVAAGGLVDGSISVTVPAVANQNPNDRAARYMPGFVFSGTLAGAIHKIQINGTVTV